MTARITPLTPSRRATARVLNPLPVPEVCQHCNAAVKLVNNSEIYGGREFGEWPWAYRCTGCGAYVGLHPFTAIPLGTLANSEMRNARKTLKEAFNPLWQHGSMTRSEAYAWLAQQMGISEGECHIGWFDVKQCTKALAIVKRKPRGRRSERMERLDDENFHYLVDSDMEAR